MIDPKPKHARDFTYYFFERLPAFISIALLVFLLFGGILWPEGTAYLIISLNVYFFYKSATLAIFLSIVYLKIRNAESASWQKKLEVTVSENRDKHLAELQSNIAKLKELDFNEVKPDTKESRTNFISRFNRLLPKFMQKIAFNAEKKKAIRFEQRLLEDINSKTVYTDWREIQHIVIIPHVKEPEHILRETLENLKKQTFPRKQINVVLAAEGRDPNGLPLSQKLAEEYAGEFNNIWVSNHILTDEEIVGKSSNMKAGGTVAYNEIMKMGWDLKKTLVTSCDADSKLPDQYFSYITYEYVTREDAEYKFFNATMVFYNNIWRLPFYARIKNSMSTLFAASRLARTDKLVPFSTYTTSFWVIQSIGFWTPWVTPEDFHLFFKAQFHFGSVVSVVPIFLRIMSDAAEGTGHLDTIKNNYNQERRWQWGISDDGWVLQNAVFNFWKHDFVTIYRALHAVFDHILAPIMGIMLIIGGNVPPLINPRFNATVLGAQLPRVSSTIITASLVFLLFIIVLDFAFRPRRKGWWPPFAFVIQLLEWLCLPVASFVLAILPGIEANTRLLFGRYLEYYVTKKQ